MFWVKTAIAGAAIFTSACVWHPRTDETAWVWPPPPADSRITYLATLRAQDSLETGSGPALRRWLHGQDQAPAVFAKPWDVAANAELVVVSDSVSARVYVFDLARRRVFPIGWRGPGQLQKPVGVAVGLDGRIYVADSARRVVYIYDRLGLHLQTLGQDADWERPVDVAVNAAGDRIYVLDAGGISSPRHRVLRLDAQGTLLGEMGTRGTQPGQFNLPMQLSVAANGDVFVLDSGNFRIQVFAPDGRWLRQFGQAGDHPGDFARPRGMAVDRDGHVLVSDSAFQNVQIFSVDGEWLMTFGEAGQGPGHFMLPAGVACDAQHRVYIVDQYDPRVDIYKLLPPP